MDRVYGCIYGQAIGDALGARYEFQTTDDIQDQIRVDSIRPCVGSEKGHLSMLGGGEFDLSPGQITDDTELALAMARCILNDRDYKNENVAQSYVKWYYSNPFDIGHTTTKCLAETNLDFTPKENLNIMMQNANHDSLSNGCLMRISPLAIYGRLLNLNVLIDLAVQNCKLTNPNPICLDAVSVYVASLWTAMKTGDRNKVYQVALRIAKTDTIKQHLIDAKNYAEPCQIGKKQVKTDYHRFKGYLGIALQNAYFELLYGKSFESSMLNILNRGGDTDTNACIAGALIGPIYGKTKLPKDWVETIDQNDGGFRRSVYPESRTNDLAQLAKGLIECSKENPYYK